MVEILKRKNKVIYVSAKITLISMQVDSTTIQLHSFQQKMWMEKARPLFIKRPVKEKTIRSVVTVYGGICNYDEAQFWTLVTDNTSTRNWIAFLWVIWKQIAPRTARQISMKEQGVQQIQDFFDKKVFSLPSQLEKPRADWITIVSDGHDSQTKPRGTALAELFGFRVFALPPTSSAMNPIGKY